MCCVFWLGDQECEAKAYDRFLAPGLDFDGFKGIYLNKTGQAQVWPGEGREKRCACMCVDCIATPTWRPKAALSLSVQPCSICWIGRFFRFFSLETLSVFLFVIL